MNNTFFELVWIFFAYSFAGWILETIVGTVNRKQFVNRGFVTGPICMVYGIAAVGMSLFLWELIGNIFALFLGCAVIATVTEWFAGKMLEKMNRKKWWDYSHKRWNFDGYICLSYSILWGILGVLSMKFVTPFLVRMYHFVPELVGGIFLWILMGVAFLDLLASAITVSRMQHDMPRMQRFHRKLGGFTYRFENWIVSHVGHRMVKAYPVVAEKKEQVEKEGKFAEGCGFYKLFWLFFIGAFLGDIVETIFCRMTAGVWMSRSSLVWGPFSIVWGLALVIATALMYKDRDKPDRHIFLVGTFLGGAYEYICSVFTEIVFGKVFWDYSGIPFNLGGRINLLYCFFWGIAAVVWIKMFYPKLANLIEKIPKETGVVVTWILVVFMSANVVMSVGALTRYDARTKGIPAHSRWEEYMDEHYDDETMKRIYPNAVDA